ncbi:HAD hydrolase family protein [bacterium]|nr:HAD hydrolase family protein [bacterium]
MENTQNQPLAPKMIFCDIDGTLIDDKNVISPIAIKGLQNLINNHDDFHFALISGRAVAHEKYFYSQLGLKPTGFLIGNNGSQIYRLKDEKVIAQ